MISLDFRSKLVVFFSTVFLVAVLSKDTVFFLLILLLSIYMFLIGHIKDLKKLLLIFLAVVILRKFTQGNGLTILLPEMFLFIITRTIAILMSSIPIIRIPPGEVMAVLKKMRVPRNISLPLIFMMRFFPTIKSEFRDIVDSLKLRKMYSWKKPLLTMEYLFVPMMFSASKTAEELAAAAEVRGISANGEHTSRREIKFKKIDLCVVVISLVSIVLMVYLERSVLI